MVISKQDLLAGLAKLNANEYSYHKDRVVYGEFIESLDEQFRIFVEQSPNEPEVYLLWAIFTMMDFLDEDGAIKICTLWWESCQDPLALIFHAYILDQYQGGVSEHLFQEMQKVETVSDAKVGSLLFMYMGLYFVNKPDHSQDFVEYLEKSINVYQHNVHGNVELGRFYEMEKDGIRAKYYFRQAISNVILVYDDPLGYDMYSGEGYINSLILWSDCNKPSFELLKGNLSKLSI